MSRQTGEIALVYRVPGDRGFPGGRRPGLGPPLFCNVNNDCLARAGFGLLPHWLLDFVALRLAQDAYAAMFRETLDRYSIARGCSDTSDTALAKLLDFHARLLHTVRHIVGAAHG